MPISIQEEPDLTCQDFVDILQRSNLAARRPVHEIARIEGMLRNASLILTARTDAGQLVGVSRAITDWHYCTYLSDLAVDLAYQCQGIGKRLVRETQRVAGLDAMLVLLAAPAAQEYYPKIGMQPHPSCWIARAALPE